MCDEVNVELQACMLWYGRDYTCRFMVIDSLSQFKKQTLTRTIITFNFAFSICTQAI